MDESKTTNFRPTFLTVLCVLTFIGSGFQLYKGVGEYFATPNETFSTARDIAPELNDYFNASEEKLAMESETKSVIKIIGAFLCLLGAWKMWNLRKTGFYIYLVGVAIEIIGIMYKQNFNNEVFLKMTLAAVGVSLLMSSLYLINYKHLRS